MFLYFPHSPEQRFTDLVREDSEEDPLPKLILKRQNSLSDESGPPEVCMYACYKDPILVLLSSVNFCAVVVLE